MRSTSLARRVAVRISVLTISLRVTDGQVTAQCSAGEGDG